MADNDPGTPKIIVVAAIVHHISLATARAGPSKHLGGLMGTVDVVVVAVQYTGSRGQRSGPARQNTWAASWAGRSGPYRAHISWAAARPGPSNFHRIGRDPAQPITCSILHGPARPGQSNFQKSRLGPARPITFSKVSARPDSARPNFEIGPARPSPEKRPMKSPGRTV